MNEPETMQAAFCRFSEAFHTLLCEIARAWGIYGLLDRLSSRR